MGQQWSVPHSYPTTFTFPCSHDVICAYSTDLSVQRKVGTTSTALPDMSFQHPRATKHDLRSNLFLMLSAFRFMYQEQRNLFTKDFSRSPSLAGTSPILQPLANLPSTPGALRGQVKGARWDHQFEPPNPTDNDFSYLRHFNINTDTICSVRERYWAPHDGVRSKVLCSNLSVGMV